MEKRVRYHAARRGAFPHVWGTVTRVQRESSKAAFSAPSGAEDANRQGPESKVRSRTSSRVEGGATERSPVPARLAPAKSAAPRASRLEKAFGLRMRSRAGRSRPVPIAQAAQRQLDVDDEGLRGVLELVEAAVELRVVGGLRLVRLGQVLQARRPFHEALQAGLAMGVHV